MLNSSQDHFETALSTSGDFLSSTDSDDVNSNLQISNHVTENNALAHYDPGTIDNYGNLEAILLTSQSQTWASGQDTLPSSFSHSNSTSFIHNPALACDDKVADKLIPRDRNLKLQSISLQRRTSFDLQRQPQSSQPHSGSIKGKASTKEPLHNIHDQTYQHNNCSHETETSQDHTLQRNKMPELPPLLTLDKMTSPKMQSTWQDSKHTQQYNADNQLDSGVDPNAPKADYRTFPLAFAAQVAMRNDFALSKGFFNSAMVEKFNRQAHLRTDRNTMNSGANTSHTTAFELSQLHKDENELFNKVYKDDETDFIFSEEDGNQLEICNLQEENSTIDTGQSSFTLPTSCSTQPDIYSDHPEMNNMMQSASVKRRLTEARYLCPILGCDSTFTRKHNLKGHLRAHAGVKPYECKVSDCSKSFARSYDLRRHEKLHDGLKIHQCETCTKSFARHDALARHMRIALGHDDLNSIHLEDDDDDDDDDACSQVTSPSCTTNSLSLKESNTSQGSLQTKDKGKKHQIDDTVYHHHDLNHIAAMQSKLKFKGFPL